MKRRISTSKKKRYEAMRKKHIPIAITRLTNNIASKRLEYINNILDSINGQSLAKAKKTILAAKNQTYLEPLYVKLYQTLGMNLANEQYRLFVTTKAAGESIDELRALWLSELTAFSKKHVGGQIVSLSASLKEELLMKLDMMVANAVEQGESIEVVTRGIMGQMKDYYSEATEWQARRIAHTETMQCAGKAQEVSVDSLDIEYVRVWMITGLNTRNSHIAMEGQTAKKGEPFTLSDGSRVMFPSDSSMGASAGEIINCSCYLIFEPK